MLHAVLLFALWLVFTVGLGIMLGRVLRDR